METFFSGLLLAKIVSSVTVVVGLTLIAEYISARVAGVLSGYPLGASILLYFIGIEQGDPFAAEAAIFMCSGFASALWMLHAYHWAAGKVRPKGAQVILAAAVSLCAFLGFSAVLKLIPFTAWSAPLFTLAAMGLSMLVGRSIPPAAVTARVKTTVAVVAVRAFIAAAVLVTITGVAGLVGPEWAGLLAGFPVVVFPFVLLLHWTYSRDQVGTVLKNFPYGMGCLLVFSIACSQGIEALGIVGGLALGYGVATVYLLIYAGLARKRAKA